MEEDVYAYMGELSINSAVKDISISLYKNGQEAWKRTFNFIFANQTLNSFNLDENTGTLLALSFWYNTTGLIEPVLHRFTIDNNYFKGVINNGANEGIYDIALMPNGNSYVVFENQLELYDSQFQFIKSIPISNAPSGGNYFKAGAVFYRAHNGTLEAFSEQGEPLFSLKEESFTIDPAQISIINGKIGRAHV